MVNYRFATFPALTPVNGNHASSARHQSHVTFSRASHGLLYMFPSAWRWLKVFVPCSDWFIKLSRPERKILKAAFSNVPRLVTNWLSYNSFFSFTHDSRTMKPLVENYYNIHLRKCSLNLDAYTVRYYIYSRRKETITWN